MRRCRCAKWRVHVVLALLITIISRPGFPLVWREFGEMSATQKGEFVCLSCVMIIMHPFVLIYQKVFPYQGEQTIDISGTKVRVVRESIERYPDGTIRRAVPLEEATITVGMQKITFSYEGSFSFHQDGSLKSGFLRDYAELTVGGKKITFGCKPGSACSNCGGLDRLSCRFILFHKNGNICSGTLAGKTVFIVEGRVYTLSHPDSIEFDPSGRPVNGSGYTGDEKRVYFRTKDYRDYFEEYYLE